MFQFTNRFVAISYLIWSTYCKYVLEKRCLKHYNDAPEKCSTLFFLLKIPFILMLFFEDHKNGRLNINLSAYLCITEKLFLWTTILTNIYQLAWRIKTCGGDKRECNFNTVYHIFSLNACDWVSSFLLTKLISRVLRNRNSYEW